MAESLRAESTGLPPGVLRQSVLQDLYPTCPGRHDLVCAHRYLSQVYGAPRTRSSGRRDARMSNATVRTYERFPLARRIEHWTMMLSFTILAITGLPQRFSSSPVSIAFVGILGGIETLRTIHHIAAVVMMLGTAWHLLVFGYMSYVRRTRLTMLPTLQDAKDGWQAL